VLAREGTSYRDARLGSSPSRIRAASRCCSTRILFGWPIPAACQPLLHPPHVDPSTKSDRNGRKVTASNQLKAEPLRQAGCLGKFRNGNQLGHHLPPNWPVFPDERMGEVYSGFVFQTLRSVASRVDHKLPGTPAQKPNAPPVSDAYKKVQIQGKRFGTGKDSATAAVLIAELHFVRSAADDLAQFLTIKEHAAGDASAFFSPDDPRARGENKISISDWIL